MCGWNLIKKGSSINRIVRRILYIKTTQSATTTIAAAWTETIKQTNDIHFFTDNLPSLSHTPLASPSCAYVRRILRRETLSDRYVWVSFMHTMFSGWKISYCMPRRANLSVVEIFVNRTDILNATNASWVIFSCKSSLAREMKFNFWFQQRFCIANRMQRAEICDNSEKHHFNLH